MKDKIRNLFATGLFHIFGSSVINNMVSFVSAIILVRVISKADYGVFTYAWNIFSLITLVSGFGTDAGALQLCSENISNRVKFDKIYQFALRFGIAFNLLLALLTLIIGAFVPLPIKGASSLLCMMALLPECMYCFTMQLIYLRSSVQNKAYARGAMFNTVIVAALTIIGAYSFAASGMVFGRYASYILSAVFGYYCLKIPFVRRNSETLDKKSQKDLLRISGISLLNNSLSQLLYLIDVFVIGLVMKDELQVATYKVATQIPTALTFIPLAIVTYIYPFFVAHRMDRNWCIRRYRQVVWVSGVFNFFASLVLIILAPWIIRTVFGEQYLNATMSFRILMISYFFSGTFRIIAGNLLVTQRKLLFNTFVAVFSGVVNVIADYVLIKYWQINGAAVATLVVVVITSVLNVFYFRKTINEIHGNIQE